jgi:hypothetical protein
VHTESTPVFANGTHKTALAELRLLWRPVHEGWLVTVSLSNTQCMDPKLENNASAGRERAIQRNRLALFEVQLRCVIDAGTVGPYPGQSFADLTEEEQELELQYQAHRVYAVGHGAAVDWTLAGEQVNSIRTEFLPAFEVPTVSTEVPGVADQVLRLDWLARIEDDPQRRCDALADFVVGYRRWLEAEIEPQLAAYQGERLAAATRIRDRIRLALKRMDSGVALLRADPLATRAFGLANLAVFRAAKHPTWRPFQLAFLLLTCESTINDDSDFRDLVDLIWFPTGGGKTEAYLGLMAFLICWRRMRFGDAGGGTTVLMRYTLRLLTKDQFRRAARLICELELLRRQHPDVGREPITLGLWVGGSSSPNRYIEAVEVLQRAVDTDGPPPSLLVLRACPQCGHRFNAKDNYDAGPKHFHFRCTNPDCKFGGTESGRLPVNVVDAALYDTPPTLLLATIDKFARLAWEERAGAFFGRGAIRPPELIIQDELHLIASALGSVAGLYEAGIETVIRARDGGLYPKYIASTATIRMASEQVRALYGREAAVFPPPGLDCDDAYFARTVPVSDQTPGRLYVGYLAPARDRGHCLAPLAGALLAAPEVLFADRTKADEAMLDAWWTLMVYHGSLRGVGISRNAEEAILSFMTRYQEEQAEAADGTAPRRQRRERFAERITQLTSNMSADENAETFERLRYGFDHPNALDMVLATNMISVGLDVGRLALMVVNGQPLTTAEYIQASSRVGRDARRAPGLVVANYYRDQARSLSHYEGFRAYHAAFYRHVEPTSVTPYTFQARQRALHAALVIAVRHGLARMSANENAGNFEPDDPDIAQAIDILARRTAAALSPPSDADPRRCAVADEHKRAVEQHLDDLADQWRAAAIQATERGERLLYAKRGKDRKDKRLLYAHDARVTGLWPTLNNMRNVENEALVKLL